MNSALSYNERNGGTHQSESK